ncbi:C4-dicarboxylate ABC transporter substrate-binding protein [Pseudoalteromonas ulvae]|uniref:C4-dicarboxylate ABC transporter substrate-binding protein n=2 Tax=Pseudoalteromonas ulvae TaxID=107327 RepID=A0A244CPY9_PSEDV|nr:C4-dicarboxylate ABC transporter substrate-binding protein [Pseudoalteromonas ulvae]
MRKFFVFACLMFTSSPSLCLDLVTPYGDSIFHTQNLREMAHSLKQDNIAITVHSGASLYKHAEIYRAVRTGQVAMGEIFIGLLGNQNPIFQLDNLPFLVANFADAHLLWQLSRPYLAKELIKEGVMLLFAAPWPPQGIYSQVELTDLSQLHNSKMRAYSAITADLATLMKANPTSIQASEIAQAFSTGMIDSMITSPSTGVSSRAWEYVKHYSDSQAWIPKNMLVMNQEIFLSLTASQQTALLEQARKYEERAWQLAAQETKLKTQLLADNGLTITKPNQVLVNQLNTIGTQMLNDWLEISPQSSHELIKRFLNQRVQHD